MISGDDPKKEPKKTKKNTFLPIQLNTSKHRMNNSVYHSKIVIPINADHCRKIEGQ